MKRYLNKFVVRHRQSGKILKVGDDSFNQKYIHRYEDAEQWLKAYCGIWKIPMSEFTIDPYDGVPIEVRDTFLPEEHDVLKSNKVFSGKGLKIKTFERPNDSKYKVGQFQPKEIRLAESVNSFKGQPVIFHQTKRKPKKQYFDGNEQFKAVSELKDYYSLSSRLSIYDIIGKLLTEGLSKVDVYRRLKGTQQMSNSQLNRLIASV